MVTQSRNKDEIKLCQLELTHADSFLHVLEYLYTSKLVLNNQTIYRILDFMLIAKTLELTSLIEDISLLLKEGLKIENVQLIYDTAIRYDQIHLKESCDYFIDRHAEFLFAQKSLTKLSSQRLENILGRDSFDLDESKIFELVNEWHVYHNRTGNLNNELINKIRLELIPNKELLNLTHHCKLIDERKIFQILKGRILHEETTKPKRHFLTTSKYTPTKSNSRTKAGLSNRQLASGSYDKSIKIWNIDTGECILTLTGHSQEIHSLQLLANNQLASGSSDMTIKIWDMNLGECIRTLIGHSGWIVSLELLPNNKIASGSGDSFIKIWNVDSGECIETLEGHSRAVRALQLLTDSKVASGSEDDSIKFWDIDSGECICTLLGHSAAVLSLQLLSDIKLASGSTDNSIMIWDIYSGECLRTFTGHTNIVWSLHLIDNNKLASGSRDNSIKIWNIDSGECIGTLAGHTSTVFGLQLLAYNKLASSSNDTTIRIWNVDSGECIRTFTGHSDSVWPLQLLINNF